MKGGSNNVEEVKIDKPLIEAISHQISPFMRRAASRNLRHRSHGANKIIAAEVVVQMPRAAYKWGQPSPEPPWGAQHPRTLLSIHRLV